MVHVIIYQLSQGEDLDLQRSMVDRMKHYTA